MHGSVRRFFLSAGVAVLMGSGVFLSAASIVNLNPIFNGDFEMSVQSTAPGGGTIYGSYWCNAEDKVVQIPSSGGDPNNRAVVLRQASDLVIQRFPAYEYVAQGQSRHEGASASMVLNGQVMVTDMPVEARVVVEETRREMNGGFWGLYQQFTGVGDLWEDWLYFSYDYAATGAFTPMVWDGPANPYTGHYKGVNDASASIYSVYQYAGNVEATVRAWEAPHDGRVLVQCRAALYPFATVDPDSHVYLRVSKYNDKDTMNLLEQYCAELIEDSDGMTFSRLIEVETDNVIAFETREEGTPSGRSARVQLDPKVGYDGRQVVYRFGDGLSPLPSDEWVCYPPPIQIAQANEWQAFSLNVGADYISWFSRYDDFAHGPVSQLSVRLELISGGEPDVVYFDNVTADVGFLSYSEEELTAELLAELDRIVGNHMEYSVKEPGTGDPNLHARYRISVADGAQLGTYATGGYSSISQLILGLSGEFWHDEATPWLLDEVDSIVANRDAEFGVPRKYSFSQSKYLDLQTGDSIHAVNDIIFLVGMYDLTSDITYLDMAYEMGVDILTYGGDAAPLYTGEFTYQENGGDPYLQGDEYFWMDKIQWSRGTEALALVASRTAAFPQRYSNPGHAEFLSAAVGAANWVRNAVDYLGGWGAYWMRIDNPLDDLFGHNATRLASAYEATGHQAFLNVLKQGSEEFQPEWLQSLRRGTHMAGDQERAWKAWLYNFHDNPDPAAPESKWEFGSAYVEAGFNYLRSCQLGNGVWCAGSGTLFYEPGMGLGGGTPLTPADGHKFRPIATAYGDPILFAYGITSDLRDDLLAYFSTMFRLNVLHYGHYLEYVGGTAGQVGYMPDSAYPDPLPSPLPTYTSGYEFRALGQLPAMLRQLEPHLPNRRPVCQISPGNFGYTTAASLRDMKFWVYDPDGLGDLDPAKIRIEARIFQGGAEPLSLHFDPLTSPFFTYTVLSPEWIEFAWAEPVPALWNGASYRFALRAVDSSRRWDQDTVLYDVSGTGFRVLDATGHPLMCLSESGDLILKGTLRSELGDAISPTISSEFLVKDRGARVVARFDTTSGDLDLRGSLSVEQTDLTNPEGADVVFKNSVGDVVAYITSAGDMVLTGDLSELVGDIF